MNIHHLVFSELKGVQRGQDIVNYPVVHAKLGALNIKSGITRVPVGAVVSGHYHDSEEQVTVLEGRLRLTLGGKVFECGPCELDLYFCWSAHASSPLLETNQPCAW